MKNEMEVSKLNQSIQDVMSTNVECCAPSDTVSDAAMKMKQQNCGAVPVTENDTLLGMITDRDIVIRCVAEKLPASTTVSDIMSTNIVTAEPDLDIYQAAKMMAEHQIRRLPVVVNNQLTGIASLGDLAVDEAADQEASFALSEISETPQVHH
ncbi:CBS domain-containing protein [Alteribacillus sp. HJP-4]|uniref:CBS domain-containing protein n=1 Tax=Alteribacillus sp. HJP-4 TaxID=2775394 RepID=UPI0035CD189A